MNAYKDRADYRQKAISDEVKLLQSEGFSSEDLAISLFIVAIDTAVASGWTKRKFLLLIDMMTRGLDKEFSE